MLGPAAVLPAMANILSNEEREQVVALGRLGWSLRRIERETGIHRETVGGYLKAAGVEVRRGRWCRKPKPAIEVTTDPPLDAASVFTPKPADEVTTGPAVEELTLEAAGPQTSPRKSFCLPYDEFIRDALARGRNAVGIYQNLVDEYGFAHDYQSVKRYVRRIRGALCADAHPVIETAPGEEGQVDYGDGPMVRHRETGKYQRTRLFAFVLGYSRKAVRLLTWKSSSEIWARLHEQSFRRLNGAPRTVVHEYVPRNIFRLLFPRWICGARDRSPRRTVEQYASLGHIELPH